MFHRLSRTAFFVAAPLALPVLSFAQAPPLLTLEQAEATAIKNHPQIQAAQNEVNFANQQIVINRAPYFPTVTGDVTGSQSYSGSRLGAGNLQASRLFQREAQGVDIQQLVTDFGRTANLVSSARFGAQAAVQNSTATRYTVLLDVNRAYFDVLRAQATVKVAEETVSARQLLSNQVTELAKNKLRSDLDVSFADVNVSEAKLLLLRAQDSVAGALAELGRSMGSDQPANYQLSDVPLPPAPPVTADTLVAEAVNNRPELAALRASRESAYKFAAAEQDLKRPTVSGVAVAGYIPYINNSTSAPIPPEYEAVAANVSIPIFNGHLFSARQEAAYQHALEADQKLRDEQERISRDVRVAWANANDAYQRIDVTAQFLRQASLAQQLAQGRYNLGLASIVELTQALLNVTSAQIENLNSKYDYQTQYAALQFTLGLLR
ncbi:MAG TPA: TolC family protein [Bryobacteraceae bacterium]|nr:TolC family protein [Bryobacteraceae bacterium]